MESVAGGGRQSIGWDYLRDNMAYHPGDTVQRGFHFAIVDEVDSVLIDEGNSPLLLSYSVGGRPALPWVEWPSERLTVCHGGGGRCQSPTIPSKSFPTSLTSSSPYSPPPLVDLGRPGWTAS